MTDRHVIVTTDNRSVITLDPVKSTLVVRDNPTSTLITSGSQGPPGIDGDRHYAHVQHVSATIWTVNHGLDKYPSVTVVDSANTEVVGEVEFVDRNNCILSFNGAFSGKAYFN